MRPGQPIDAAPNGAGWHRQPVAWLAVLLLLASLAVVAITIVVAVRYPEEAVPVVGPRVLKTPVTRDVEPVSDGAAETAQ